MKAKVLYGGDNIYICGKIEPEVVGTFTIHKKS
jgi:hypothetical protein